MTKETKPWSHDWLERIIIATLVTILLTGASTYLAHEHVRTDRNTVAIEGHEVQLKGAAGDMKEVKETLIRVEGKVDHLTELMLNKRP